MKLTALFLLALPLWSQTAPQPPVIPPDVLKAIQAALAAAQNPPTAPAVPVPTPSTSTAPATPLPIPLPPPGPITYLPKLMLTVGGGFASPSGSFAYASASWLTLPQQTYVTMAQEYTLLKGQIRSCTFGGVTKPMYQFYIATFGITGLGGGCNSTSGSSTVAGSGQGFMHLRIWKSIGFVGTFMKDTNSAYKVTGGITVGQ